MGSDREGILVLGSLRSGTTLLRRLLDAHPNIACPAETYLFTACARFLHAETVGDGLQFGVVNGLGFAGFESEEVHARLRELAFGFHRDHARRQGKKRWAEKTAVDSFYLDEIEALCDDRVQYLCMTRHGLDVACSIEELSSRGMTYLSEVHEYVKRYPRPLEAFAHAWVDVTRDLLAFMERHPNNTLWVKYEELTANPKAELARILAFLGEDGSEDLIERALRNREGAGLGDWKTYGKSHVDDGSVERWRSLPPYTRTTLAHICNATLEACGYPPVRTHGLGDQQAARRRYQLGLMLQGEKDRGDSEQ